MLGYGPTGIGESLEDWEAIVHPDDRAFVMREMQRHLEGKSSEYLAEFRMLAGDGTWRWIRGHGKVIIRDEIGKPIRVIGTQSDITDRKRMEQDLHEKSGELEDFFNIALDLLAIANLDGYFVRLNPSWEQVLGYRVEDLEGHRFLDLVHPEDLDATLQAMATLGAGGQILNFVNRYRTAHGDYRFIEWRCRLHGHLIYAAARDITQQVESDRRLRAEKSLLATFVEYAPAAIAMFDRGMNYLAASSRWLGDHGLLGRNVLGKCHYDLLPDTSNEWRDIHSRALGGAIQTRDHDVWQPPGGRLAQHLKWEARPWYDAEGEIGGILISTQDITRSHDLEVALARRNEALDAALTELQRTKNFLEQTNSIAKVGGWEVDLVTNALVWTSATRQIHEVDEEYVPTIEEAIKFYHPGPDRELITQLFRQLVEYGAPFEEEFRFDTAGGRTIWVKVLGEGESVNGRIVRAFGAIQDVTERKSLETLLVKACHRAEEANIAKSAFLSNMSHEIRTPLNAIIGMAELLQGADVSPELRSYVETIRTSGDALLALINDILDFSKIEAGHLALENVPFNLRECVEGAVDLVAPKAAEKRIELMCRVDAAVPTWIEGDPVRLRQIVLNLVSNAVKFTNEGEVLVEVIIERGDMGEELLHIAVRDTGIGIPADRLDRLFQRFSQIDASTARLHGGTGLGLAISARLVALMGGRIGVDSQPGEGSEFHAQIPLKRASNRQSADQVTLAARQRLEGKRILLVEDNATNRLILERQMASWGIVLIVAESARAALDLLESGAEFHLAIIDGLLPDMEGKVLAENIRQRRLRESLPIIILTSFGSHDGHAKRLGLAAMLSKPVKTHQLLEAILGAFREPAEPIPATPRPTSDQLGKQHPLRILLAEDNPVNQKVATLLLERLGYSDVTYAGNGHEALNEACRNSYDVILMDIQMPEMDGLEACRRIRTSLTKDARPWIIALTANATEQDRHACLAAGMDDYLSKPVRSADLANALMRAKPAV
jgi:PAS domain S-box-containing protein